MVDRCSYYNKKKGNKKSQVTIFIILGLVMVLVFLFLLQLSNKMKKEQLEREKENIFSKVLEKEGLRLYIQDCLEDDLVKGLDLLGKQGRIWLDQGGKEEFFPNENGRELDLDGELIRVFYGIQKLTMDPYNKYPCDEEDGGESPEFCRYSYPDISKNFGDKKRLTIDHFPEDLESFLLNKMLECVNEFSESKLLNLIELERKDFRTDVRIDWDGISVVVDYPLKFNTSDEFFVLSAFETYYVTPFRKLVDMTVLYPIHWDYSFIDFPYKEDKMQSNSFQYGVKDSISDYCEDQDDYYLCNKDIYTNWPITFVMERKDYDGDDLFTFTSADQKIRILRQNRPPALDYVNRSGCLERDYDYLVIKKGDESLVEGTLTDYVFDDPVKVGDASSLDLYIKNEGNSDITVNNVYSEDGNFLIEGFNPSSIEPDEELSITFSPTTKSYFEFVSKPRTVRKLFKRI